MKTHVCCLFLGVVLLSPSLAAQPAQQRLADIETRLAALEEKIELLLALTRGLQSPSPGPKLRGRSLSSWLQDLNDRDDGVRREAGAAILHFGEDALPLLREALKDSDWLLRLEAVDLLGSSRFLGRTWEALGGMLSDADARVRREAAEKLAGLQGLGTTPEAKKAVEATLPALVAALQDGTEPVQLAAAGAVAALGSDEQRAAIPAPLLEKALNRLVIERDVLARASKGAVETQGALALARALVGRGPEAGKAALPALLRMLESSAIQVETAVLLGELGAAASEAVPRLQELRSNYEDSVESAVALAESIESGPSRGGKQKARPAVARRRSVVRIVSDEEAAQAAEAVQKIEAALEKIEAGARQQAEKQ